ncbi:MAG: DNA-processing protein DprA [Holosporales bacterium]|jgi:DNA processing protein|nr:DNA-processing protein DprA [Holosporales bacterium]
MFDEVVLDWFCLINSKGIGPKTFWSMMRKFGTAKESLKHVATSFSRDKAKKILHSMNCGIILANEPIFPRSLRRSSSCPPILFYKGDKSILSKRRIAIIGARNASIAGKSIAKSLALNLANDFAIISGLAKGIDTAAHQGSLERLENKATISVLPFGFDNIYPKENLQLYEKIAKNALVLTETPNRYINDQGAFLARNRIIALLAEAIVVIEAAAKSGTMTTAQMALDLGCDVLVVPGSPLDPRYFGSNLLIKNGATLIQNHFDVLDALIRGQETQRPLPMVDKEQKETCAAIGDSSSKILSMLSEVPVSIDEIAVNANMNIKDLLCVISELELMGKVVKHSMNEVVLMRK